MGDGVIAYNVLHHLILLLYYLDGAELKQLHTEQSM